MARAKHYLWMWTATFAIFAVLGLGAMALGGHEINCMEPTVDGSPASIHSEWSWIPLGDRCVAPAEHPGGPGWGLTVATAAVGVWVAVLWSTRSHKVHPRERGPRPASDGEAMSV